MRLTVVIAALMAVTASPAAAQLDPTACGTQDFPLPAPFETWGHPREPRPWLRLNETQSITLYRGVRFASGAATSERPRRFSGAVGFAAERDGEYRIAVSGSGAVDMLRDGETVPSHRPPQRPTLFRRGANPDLLAAPRRLCHSGQQR